MRNITVFRVLRGLRQWDLSMKAEIPNYRLCKIERGNIEPTEEELARIASALEVSVVDLQSEIHPDAITKSVTR